MELGLPLRTIFGKSNLPWVSNDRSKDTFCLFCLQNCNCLCVKCDRCTFINEVARSHINQWLYICTRQNKIIEQHSPLIKIKEGPVFSFSHFAGELKVVYMVSPEPTLFIFRWIVAALQFCIWKFLRKTIRKMYFKKSLLKVLRLLPHFMLVSFWGCYANRQQVLKCGRRM